MKQEISSGGLVFKQTEQGRLWLLVKHAQAKHWGFPKGMVGDLHKNETLTQAALREVLEEGGIEAKIVAKITSPSRYFYTWRGEKIQKTVWYYIMEYVSGSPENHDVEVEIAQFVAEDTVLNMLTYKNDAKIFAQTKAHMSPP